MRMRKEGDFQKLLFLVSFLLLNSFSVLGEMIEIKEISSVEAPFLEEMSQFSDEKFEFYYEEDGKLKNREVIYWIVLSGLILLFIVVLSYIIYLFFKKEK